MERYLTLVIAAVLSALVGGLATPAQAQTAEPVADEAPPKPKASVLGSQTDESTADLGTKLTAAMRAAVTQLDAWELDARTVSLNQMRMAHGCQAADAACMQQTAGTLGVEVVFFATVKADTGSGHPVSVQLYDGQDLDEKSGVITTEQTAPDQLVALAVEYISDLAGIVRTGTLRIKVDQPGAAIRVNGELKGSSSAEPMELELTPRDHAVEVQLDGYETFNDSVTVVASSVSTVEVTLVEAGNAAPPPAVAPTIPLDSDDTDPMTIVGWSLVGLGAVGLGVGTVFAILTPGLEDADNFKRYRDELVPEGKDVCTEADKGNQYGLTRSELDDVVDACSNSETYVIMQIIGFSVGALALAGGIVILLTNDDDDPQQAKLRFDPILGRTQTGLSATLTF